MTKKKPNKRSKSKYPALAKHLNLKSRQESIEPQYINGVFDKDGKEVIRRLTEDEKAWLNQFYEETVITNFLHDPELRKLAEKKKSIVYDDIVMSLKEELKVLREDPEVNKKRINEIRKIIKLTKKQNLEIYQEEIEKIEIKMQEVREKRLLFPNKEDHKKFYGDNNARNNCVYTKLNSMNRLVFDTPGEYEDFLNQTYALEDFEYEEELINFLEADKYEQEEKRLLAVQAEEVSKKQKKS